MKYVTLAIRIAVLVAALGILWRTVPRAMADHYAATGTEDGYKRAIAMLPGNADLISARAVFLSVTGDPSPAVDQALRSAIDLNPADSDALIALGLRAELRGDKAGAQTALERAAVVSHLFQPSWALANFYFRTGQDAKFWPMVRRCLEMIEVKDLHPVAFDPAPVFDLAWHQDPDAARIRAVVPRRAATLIPYLTWLSATGRTEPALAIWPDVLAVADPALQHDGDALISFADYLIDANRSLEASSVWNDAVRRGFIQSAPLDPSSGNSVENPEFEFPSIGRAFSWYTTPQPGVFITQASHALRFELTGSEPENLDILWKRLPVVPGRKWRLVWDADTARLEKLPPVGSGLAFGVEERPGGIFHACAPLGREGKGTCEISTLPSTKILRLTLHYQRPLGATRLRGVFTFASVRLSPAPESPR